MSRSQLRLRPRVEGGRQGRRATEGTIKTGTETRRIIATNIVSLDGQYEGPSGNPMALPMDGAFDDYNLECLARADAVLLGGASFRMFSGFWPAMADNPDASPTHQEFSKRYNEIEKIAASDTLQADEVADAWRDTTTIVRRGDLHRELAERKAQTGKDIVVFGSHVLWNDLLAHQLLDELHLMVGNVVLGGDTPAFTEPIAYDDPRIGLEIVDARTFDGSQNVLHRYRIQYRS